MYSGGGVACCVEFTNVVRFFGYTVTLLALQLRQERIQVVYSPEVAWQRLTESNSTPAMGLGHMDVVLKRCMLEDLLGPRSEL